MDNFCDWYTIFAKGIKDDIESSRMSQVDKEKYIRKYSFDPKTPGYCKGGNSKQDFSKQEKSAEKAVFQGGYWFIAGQGLGDHDDVAEEILGMYKRSWDIPDWFW